ncbi:MAG: alpha/beta hydrolase-fold protein [Bacteroidota bacterium]
MREEYLKWYSPNLSKDIEMLKYGHAGHPVLIFPTTMGRYFESKDFGLIEASKWFIEQGLVTIYAIDSIDKYSWYNKNIHPADRVKNHIWYDKMLVEEIVNRVRWSTNTGKVAVAGASFGGFHAANFAFKHPYLVDHLFTMSGAFSIKSFMDGYYDENVYFNNPIDFLPGANHGDLYSMNIILGTSEYDICKGPNFEMAHILGSKGIHHWLDVRPQGPHDWPLWLEMFPHYLSTIHQN